MGEIAPLYSDGCLARGISIMRTALGYEKGLPEGWKISSETRKEFTILDEMQAVVNAFPEHVVRIICTKDLAREAHLRRDQYIEGIFANHLKAANNHIFAYAYVQEIANLHIFPHFVISNPTSDMINYILYTVMVSIKRKNEK
jgi:hypothetical protein